MNAVDSRIFNALGLSSVINAKDNTIKSLEGKIEYLKNQLADNE